MHSLAGWFLWLPICLLGMVATFAALMLAGLVGGRWVPEWLGLALNLLPAFAVGVGCYAWLRRRARPGMPHLALVAPLYLVGALLGAVLIANWSVSGFGLIMQLYLWPLVTCLGGVVGDLLAAPSPTTREAIVIRILALGAVIVGAFAAVRFFLDLSSAALPYPDPTPELLVEQARTIRQSQLRLGVSVLVVIAGVVGLRRTRVVTQRPA